METVVGEAPNLDKVIREDFSGMGEEKLACSGEEGQVHGRQSEKQQQRVSLRWRDHKTQHVCKCLANSMTS